MPFNKTTATKDILNLKETSASAVTVSKPIVLNPSTLDLVDKVLIADETTGYITLSKNSADVTVEDLRNDVNSTSIRAFGLNSAGSVICGIIFLPSTALDTRDALVFPNGVIEVHTKISTSPGVSYSS